MSIAKIGKLQENTTTLCKIGCETLQVSTVGGSGYVWSWKLKCHLLPSGNVCRMWNIRRKWNVTRPEFRMWYIRGEGKVAAAGCNVAAVRCMEAECNVAAAGWNVAATGWNSFPGGMCGIPYSLYSGFAYGFQRTLLNLGLLWWSKSYQNTKT